MYSDMRVPFILEAVSIDLSLSIRKIDLLSFILSNEGIVKLDAKNLCQILCHRFDMLYL